MPVSIHLSFYHDLCLSVLGFVLGSDLVLYSLLRSRSEGGSEEGSVAAGLGTEACRETEACWEIVEDSEEGSVGPCWETEACSETEEDFEEASGWGSED